MTRINQTEIDAGYAPLPAGQIAKPYFGSPSTIESELIDGKWVSVEVVQTLVDHEWVVTRRRIVAEVKPVIVPVVGEVVLTNEVVR